MDLHAYCKVVKASVFLP